MPREKKEEYRGRRDFREENRRKEGETWVIGNSLLVNLMWRSPGRHASPSPSWPGSQMASTTKGTFAWKHMAMKYHKFAAIGTSCVAFWVFWNHLGLPINTLLKSNSNWTGVTLGAGESHLALIRGIIGLVSVKCLTPQAFQFATPFWLTFHNPFKYWIPYLFKQLPYWSNSSDQLNSTRSRRKC